jgi:23S rRNA (adenine-N6)-dimethyltransferase
VAAAERARREPGGRRRSRQPQPWDRRPWGWHPLSDAWAARIVADAVVRPAELVLDLGAGHGVLTHHLIAAGAQVLAVELHPDRARRLRQRFAGQPVRVIEVDATTLRLPRRPFRVVASPPYGITSELMRVLLGRDSALVAADLVLQRAAVRRLVDGWGPDRWYRRWSLTAGRPLPRQAFDQPPTVDSRVLVIRRR